MLGDITLVDYDNDAFSDHQTGSVEQQQSFSFKRTRDSLCWYNILVIIALCAIFTIGTSTQYNSLCLMHVTDHKLS